MTHSTCWSLRSLTNAYTWLRAVSARGRVPIPTNASAAGGRRPPSTSPTDRTPLVRALWRRRKQPRSIADENCCSGRVPIQADNESRCIAPWKAPPAPVCCWSMARGSSSSTGSSTGSLDLDHAAALELLLQHDGDRTSPARNAPLTDWGGSLLLWAYLSSSLSPAYRGAAERRSRSLGTHADGVSDSGWRCSSGPDGTSLRICVKRAKRKRSPRTSSLSPRARAAMPAKPGVSGPGGRTCRRRCRKRNCDMPPDMAK